MSDPWDKVRQGFEFWAYARGANDRRAGAAFNPPHGGQTEEEQQLYVDGWFDSGMGRDRSEAMRRWPDFVDGFSDEC
jgi:hypothetical protein